MKLDDLFGKAPIVTPPDTLKTKVMRIVEREAASDDKTPIWAGLIIRNFFTKRSAISFAIVSAALLLTFTIFPGAYVTTEPGPVAELTSPPQTVSNDEISEFVEEALSQVYSAEPGMEFTYEDESMDNDLYISIQLEEIFWINGGNNA